MADLKNQDGEARTKLFEKIKYKISGKVKEEVSMCILRLAGIRLICKQQWLSLIHI